jgi:hypothetical protein
VEASRLGNISELGDRYLRGPFVAGALAVIRYAKIHGTKRRPWLTALLARRPTKVAAIALANKIARMVLAMMVKGERYACAVNEIAPNNRRDVKVGRANSRAGRSGGRDKPTRAIAFLNASYWSGPDPRRALWPAVM